MPPIDPTTKFALERGRRAKWWRRKGSTARGFRYFTNDGQQLSDEQQLERIRSLVIPPAWQNVLISPAAGGKIQAVGVDNRGRIQYIYHPKFTEAQQRKKFSRIEKFGEHMPELRRITNEHISLDGFPREKVLAIMTRLINSLYIRIGTDRSVRNYRTYGITTLGKRHVTVYPKGKVVFEFVGKSKKKHKKVLVDPELAALIKELASLGGGRKLFKYFNGDNRLRPIKPNDINAYIKSATAAEYSAKDFRTWGASLLTAVELAEAGICDDVRLAQKNIVNTVRNVSDELGNTPTVCRSSYIHPKILKAYLEGVTIADFTPRRHARPKRLEPGPSPEEVSLMRLFKRFP